MEEEIIVIETEEETEIVVIENDVEFIKPITQEITIAPSFEEIVEIPDENYTGFSKVTVTPIPEEYIIPSGEINITENGSYDVVEKAVANINVPEKLLGTKVIDKNGTYNASDDGIDGYSSVEVATSGVDINDYYINPTANNVIRSIKRIPPLVISSTSMSGFAQGLINLEEFPAIDTSNVKTMSSVCNGCTNLKKIPLLDFSNVTNLIAAYDGCSNLTDLSGFKNLGMSYAKSLAANYTYYRLNLSGAVNLTEQSIINVLNNLYDIKSKGCNVQQIILGATNLAKLTSEAGIQALADAEAKGWAIS